MELYFQEHDVSASGPSRAGSIDNQEHDLLLRLAGLVVRLVDAEGAERDILNNQIQNLLSDVALTDPSAPGKPPASVEAIRTLPVINVRPGADGNNPSCPICTEEFDFNEPARRLPCGHLFHADCIIPWLKRHCTCPMCREELPTDNAAYEQEKKYQKRQAAVSQMQNLMFN